MQEIKVWAVPAGYCGESDGSTNVVDMVKRSDYESDIREARKEGFMEGRADALTANDFRKQGAEEERRRIEKAYDEARCDHMAQDAFQIAIKARGAAEPVCTCAWVGDHHPDCPCYKSPEPKPLEKVVLDGDSYCNDRTWAVKFNALIDHVNRIEARGRP